MTNKLAVKNHLFTTELMVVNRSYVQNLAIEQEYYVLCFQER